MGFTWLQGFIRGLGFRDLGFRGLGLPSSFGGPAVV